eukprot:3118165-Rhodomonas_salina.1
MPRTDRVYHTPLSAYALPCSAYGLAMSCPVLVLGMLPGSDGAHGARERGVFRDGHAGCPRLGLAGLIP